MSVRVKILARAEDGGVRTFTANDLCYRSLGKMSGYLGAISEKMRGASPVTLTHENMANLIPEVVTEEHVSIFKHLWSIVPALRACITTPEEILSSGRATFDVANYSLNECMVGMFFMRTLVNDHAATLRASISGIAPRNLAAMYHLIHNKGWSWEKAYMFVLYPTHSDSFLTSSFSSHLGGSDASCFNYQKVAYPTLLSFIAGEYTGWDICPLTYREVLDKGEGYTANIRDQVKGGKGAPASHVFKSLVERAHRLSSSQASQDLFGGSFGEDRTEGMDYLDAWGQVYDNSLEEVNASN